MRYKKTATKWAAAAFLSGSLVAAGTELSTDPVSASSPVQSQSVETLYDIYNSAYTGKMPNMPEDIIINEDTREDVRDTFGQPPTEDNGSFDVYPAEMGHPGYAFGFNGAGTVTQIRYFGTNVERQTNLGSITPKVLEREIGGADHIRDVVGTNEIDYIYQTGDYELHFIIGDDQTVDHINLKGKNE